jgi:hypothetical protein
VEGVINGHYTGSSTNVSLTLNRQFVSVFRVGVSGVYSGINIDINTAGDSGCVGFWGLYKVDHNGDASERVAHCTGSTASTELDFSVSTSGSADFEGGDLYIPRGDYVQVMVAFGGATIPQVKALSSTNLAGTVFGSESASTPMRMLKDGTDGTDNTDTILDPFALKGVYGNSFGQPLYVILVAA